jgi:hypothetical protein
MSDYPQLAEIADSIQRDVGADYDLWVEELEGQTYGVIDMGDAGCWAYVVVEGRWMEAADGDPRELLDRIVRERQAFYGSRLRPRRR